MTTKDKPMDATDEASLIDDWGPTLEAFNAGLSLGGIRKTLNVDTGNKGAQRVNNKPWDVTPERLAKLIGKVEQYDARPKSQISALEFSLANWHSLRGQRVGTGICGCCSWMVIQGVDDCGSCPLAHDGDMYGRQCCNGLWIVTVRNRGTDKLPEAAEAVYQFILGKYWEVKERVQDE